LLLSLFNLRPQGCYDKRLTSKVDNPDFYWLFNNKKKANFRKSGKNLFLLSGKLLLLW